MNPKNAEGNVTRCRLCESKYHWVENCPVQADQLKTPAKTDISLFQSQNTDSDEVRRCWGESELSCFGFWLQSNSMWTKLAEML